MTDRFALLKMVFESALGERLDEQAPRQLSGMQVVEALWPLNEVFRSRLERIRAVAYDKAFEPIADAAIERCVLEPWPPRWDELPPGAWRVLLERHQQALTLAIANEQAGNPLMSVPQTLNERDITPAAMVFLLYQMKLPWPPSDSRERR